MSTPAEHPRVGEYQIYFGDLHNHNEVGYARGSLERAFEIAREHLDFFAFTPHGYWNDIGHYQPVCLVQPYLGRAPRREADGVANSLLISGVDPDGLTAARS